MVGRKLETTDLFKSARGSGLVVIEGDDAKRLQQVLLEGMRDILEVCEENEIDIFLGGGTCLGAVRHKGFIPWDDDIDLNITREGYERFKPLFAEKYGDKYWVLDAESTQDFAVICPQVRRKGTVVRSRDDFYEDGCGACIDLCIIESVPDNRVLRCIQGVVSLALGLLASCRRFSQHKEDYLHLVADNPEAVDTVKLKSRIGDLLFFTTYGGLNRVWDKWNSLSRNTESRYVSIPGGRKHYFGEMCLRDVFFPTSRGVFEGLGVPLPRDFDAYMRALYGDDYMQLPPESEREHHAVVEFDISAAVSEEHEDRGKHE